MKVRKYTLFLALIAILSVLAVVAPAIPASAAGSLVMDSYGGPAGTYVTVQGMGFTGSSSYSLRFYYGTGTIYNQVVATGTVASGSFIAYFLVPNYPRNTYTVTATTDIVANAASTTYTITPYITSNYSSGKVGDQLTIAGYGFTGSYTISGYFDNKSVSTAYTDASGSFSMTMIVPETYKGNHAIKVQDNISASPTVAFTVNPSVTVNPTSVAIGGQISVAGKGFTASSTVSFTLDGTAFGTGVNTNSLGTFAATALTVPAVPAGTHTLSITDGSGAYVTTTVTTSNSVTISPQSGSAGTTITITGKGFEVDKQITITLNGAPVNTNPSVITSDGGGSFTATITAPNIPAGIYTIAARDSTNTATASFVSSSTVSSTVTRGVVGSSVPISGNGFASGANVIIRLDNTQIATAKADSSGAFSTSVIIPASKAGTHNIVITDGTNSNTFTFTIEPTAQFGPDSGNVGTDIVIKGYSFKSGGTITIKYGNIQIGTISADVNGTFTVTFKAPASKGGEKHQITVSDGETIITSDFTMESTPPPVPALIAPEKGAKADALAKFQWQSVSDASGVIYNLQVARDAGFNDPVINKTGLESPSYEVTEADKLKPASGSKPYYWRVQAVDGASNASDWSAPQTFIVGFTMPAWAWYLIIAVGAVVIFALGFFLGRRLSSRAI